MSKNGLLPDLKKTMDYKLAISLLKTIDQLKGLEDLLEETGKESLYNLLYVFAWCKDKQS